MTMFALALALLVTPPDTTPLTFVHGDEQIVTWLDRAAVRRTGDRVRMRMLRVRHADQAFWIVQEIDCAAGTWALIDNNGMSWGDGAPPPLEGEARHMPIRRDDHSETALKAAVCDGRFVQAGIRPVRGAAAAIAALEETKRAAVRARPLQLIVIRGGRTPLFMDRATLESGGPQVEVRSLEMTGGRGVWSGWMLDCERTDLAVNLQWTAPAVGASYGALTRDENYGGEEAADAAQAELVRTACAADVWDQPVHASIDAAMRAAGANPR